MLSLLNYLSRHFYGPNKAACKDQNLEGVLLLLASGADANFRCDDDYSRTPLIAALIADVKRRLRDGDSSPGASPASNGGNAGVGGESAKDVAALVEEGRTDILECLALNGADIDAQDSHGRAALHYAAENEEGSRSDNATKGQSTTISNYSNQRRIIQLDGVAR